MARSANIYRSLLLVIAGATQKELARQVHDLKAENQILRQRLPKRLLVTPQERSRLVRLGGKLTGKVVRQLVSIVHPDTLLRWIREDRKAGPTPAARPKRGRRPTPERLRRLICKLARENAWGYTRIMGELQATQFVDQARAAGLPVARLIRDRDGAFSKAFDEPLRRRRVRVLKTQYRSPNMNAFVERFVQSIKTECLDHFIVFGTTHMDHLCREYLAYYHSQRPHQGLDNNLVVRRGQRRRPLDESLPTLRNIGCQSRLGGLLKSYYRKAA